MLQIPYQRPQEPCPVSRTPNPVVLPYLHAVIVGARPRDDGALDLARERRKRRPKVLPWADGPGAA